MRKNAAKMTSTDMRTLFFSSVSSGNNFRTAKHFADLGINISILAEKQKHSKTRKRIKSSQKKLPFFFGYKEIGTFDQMI